MPFIAPIIGAIAVTAFFVALQIVLFRVLGKLAVNGSGGDFTASPIWGLSDAVSALPGWIIQLMNWTYLDQCVMIITAALVFAAVLKFLGGIMGGGS